jgi:hypothetical protein
MNENQNQSGPSQPKQQSGQNFGSATRQGAQSLITKIESAPSQQGDFTCTNEQAVNTLLPALKAMSQQL